MTITGSYEDMFRKEISKYDHICEDISQNIEVQEQLLMQIQVYLFCHLCSGTLYISVSFLSFSDNQKVYGDCNHYSSKLSVLASTGAEMIVFHF